MTPRQPALAAALLVLAAATTPAAAQSSLMQPLPVSNPPDQVFSANPIGLIVDLVNAEYELSVGEAWTVGAGASTAKTTVYDYSTPPSPRAAEDGLVMWEPIERRERYVNGDAFLRYYPSGQAFTGFSLGVKAGVTRIPSKGEYFGLGFDINRSLMLNDHLYMSTGGGLKRLLGTDDRDVTLKIIPTLRLNIGIGF